MKDKPETLDDIFEAARQHGVDSEPDHEVGDLQDALTKTWGILTDAQKHEVLNSQIVIENFQSGQV